MNLDVKELEEIRQNIAWLREHKLAFPDHLAKNILLLEQITPRLREIWSRYNTIIGDISLKVAEWEEVLNLMKDIDVILNKMRALYNQIKAQVDIIDLIEINASKISSKHSYVKDVQSVSPFSHEYEITRGSFFTVNEPESRQLLEDAVKLFNHGDKNARQTGAVNIEGTVIEIAILCQFIEPMLLNPTVMHAAEPLVVRQIREAADRLRKQFKYVVSIVKADFLKEELAGAKECLERMLVKEEFANQKEIKLQNFLGNKKEYESLLALATKLTLLFKE